MLKFCLRLCFITCIAGPTAADTIFKCVSPARQPVYQSTDCNSGHERQPIDRCFTDTGAFELAEKKAIDAIHAQRSQEAAIRIARRQTSLANTIERQKTAKKRCLALKREVQLLYQHRRYRPVDRDTHDQLTRQMRDACSP